MLETLFQLVGWAGRAFTPVFDGLRARSSTRALVATGASAVPTRDYCREIGIRANVTRGQRRAELWLRIQVSAGAFAHPTERRPCLPCWRFARTSSPAAPRSICRRGRA